MKNKYKMKICLLFCNLFLMIGNSIAQGKGVDPAAAKEQYVCLPCGSDCDNMISSTAGNCEHCHMQLVKKSSIVFKNITPAQLCSAVAKNPDILLLDVRTPEEFNGKAEVNYGKLKNAINIPIQQLESRLGELQQYKNRQVIVYCSHSHRSPQASYLLTQNGFKQVTNMLGGMSVWKQEVNDKGCSDNIYVPQ